MKHRSDLQIFCLLNKKTGIDNAVCEGKIYEDGV